MPFNELISEEIYKFDLTNLKELDQMKLLDRYDCKYVFPSSILPKLLKELKNEYNALSINNTRCLQYSNLYYDSPDYALHRMHVNGRKPRFKVRKRNYRVSNEVFFELKKKNNKSKTEKFRFPASNEDGQLTEKELNFLKKYDVKLLDLFPSIKTIYKRITLANKNLPEKITIDFNLEFQSSFATKNIDGLIIAETKNLRSVHRTFFKSLMKENKIEPYRISKYCAGAIYTIPNIKYNRYKPKILLINKICRNASGIDSRI